MTHRREIVAGRMAVEDVVEAIAKVDISAQAYSKQVSNKDQTKKVLMVAVRETCEEIANLLDVEDAVQRRILEKLQP